MKLLHFTTGEGDAAAGIGDLPGQGLRHVSVLNPRADLAAVTRAVSASLRARPAAWAVVDGRATAPFLAAVGADLSLAVAGALFRAPAPWDLAHPLDDSPLAFPAIVLADPGELPIIEPIARAWRASFLALGASSALLSEPAVRDVMARRKRRLARV